VRQPVKKLFAFAERSSTGRMSLLHAALRLVKRRRDPARPLASQLVQAGQSCTVDQRCLAHADEPSSAIEPLKLLLEKLRAQSADGFMLQNHAGKPLSLDSLNVRIIAPAMKRAGIEWRGYYPGRRGISSRVTDTSKNALNSTGLLGSSTPITELKHYTRARKDSLAAAMKTIEDQAAELMGKQKQAEMIQ
jgi:hypothetical protein